MHKWPAAQVKVCNIGALEMVTEQMAANLQSSVLYYCHPDVFVL